MACIVKVGNKFENLSGYNTFLTDKEPNSQYFRVTKFQETFTAGKNLFLMEGSPYLKESTAIKIEIVDVNGGTLYVEPGRGIPDYYEGNSVVLSTHVYDDIPVGPAKITVLGELKEYIDEQGILRPVPEEWKNVYNVKWEKNFYINKNVENSTPVIFYKRPVVTIEETEGGLVQQIIPEVTQTGSVQGRADNPPLGTDIRTWRAGTLYRLEITDGPGFTGSIDENIISVPSLGYSATVKEVLNQNTVLVDKPYLVDNKISNFPSSPYTTTFEYFDGRTSTDTIVTGSYQRLVFKNIDTFTGNLDKIKIFRKSRSDISDFKFLEEVKLRDVTDDLLVNPTQPASEKSGGAGRFTESNFNSSWETSSIQISGSDTSITFDNDLLYESIKINVPSSSYQTESVNVVTTTEFDIYSDVDYEVSFKTLVSGSYYDSIPGAVNVVSKSVSTTTYYLYDPTVMSVYPVSYQTSTGYNSILIQSSSQDLTRNYIYDNSRLSFYDTPQNQTGSAFTSIPSGYTHLLGNNVSSSLTFDTNSADWGTISRVQTDSTNNANVVSISSSLAGHPFIVNVWLDSGSYTIPMSGNPTDVNIYSEMYSSGSDELIAISFENIGGDAKFYYLNSSTYLDELSSYRNSTEYPLEAINTSDYQSSPAWHTSGTGSQSIIPYEQNGYNYIHIDYRTNRNIEPLNGELITVQRLDRLNGDILYGESYEITSMNFNTGEIEFTDGTEADFSGTLNIQNGQLILTIDGETQYAYIVEADFNNSVMVFIGRITVGDMEPSSTRYSLYDLFQLSGSDVQNTSTSSFVVPRVPTQGGDYLYTEAGYPLTPATVSSRDYLTPVFDSPSSSLDFVSPLDIPYIFRNDDGQVTDVYTFDSSSGQIYNVSSVSSSGDINSDSFVYGNTIVQEGFVPSGSIHDDISTTETDKFVNEYVNLTFKQHNHLSGSVIISLLTDSGSLTLPTDTGSVEYHIESFVSESGYQSGNTIWRNAFAFRNFNTDGLLFYNHSSVSQSAVEAISGSLNYQLSSIDTNDFQSLPLNMLESGSQAIFDFETSGSGYNFIYLDYRTNRTRQVLNANLEEIGLVSEIDGNPIGTAIDTLALSGSEVTTITSASYYTQQVPPTTSSIFYSDPEDYPFFPTTIPAGNYIGDKTTPGQTETILNSPLNIPYVLNVSDSTPNEVIVQRLDAIYTASSAYNTTGTSVATPPVFVSKSLVEPDTIIEKTLKLYVTGSSGSGDFKQYLSEISADSNYKSRQDISNIITSTYEGTNTRLGIEARGDGWQISKLNFRPASAKGFSPKIFKTVQEEERNLQDETFDYNFEMYDVNNNYIPVKLQKTVRFTQGNKQTLGTLKLLTFESDRSAFRFYSGSIANPSFQQIRLVATKQNVSGSITYASAAFDSNGNYIDPLSYSGTYPGGLTSAGENGGIVTIANFSGSDTNYEVGSIIYTASVDDLNEYETIFRLEDGQPIADLIVNNDRPVITYKLSDGSVDPSNQVSTITVKRKNLASNSETITANSSSLVGSPPPLTLLSDNSTTGVATYFLSGSSLDLSTGSVSYQFTASDEFGLQIDNVTTITPISTLGGVVLYLSNERGVLPAYASGVIPSSSYVYTSGSTKLYIDGEQISYDNSGGINSYKIIGVTGSGITPNETQPTTNNYGGVPGTMTTDSSSMEINVRYTDSGGETYDFGREANFNIVREGADGQPGLEGSNGPGLVFTGDYDSSRDYVRTTGSLARADSVLYNNEFFLAISSSGPSYGGAITPTNSNYWEALGTASRFVAAELAIFAESYVQNTINVGTNNSGSTSAANITIAGGTNYPYISIDQGATTGTQGYNVGNGIFLGINGNTGTGSLSLESPVLGGGELLWDGHSLSIRGDITVTNTQDFITPTDTGSFTKNESTQSLENPTIYSFGPDASFTLEGVTPSTSGLYLGSGNMGYYDNSSSSWKTYMDDSGRFYLGGTAGALQWDGSQLSIEGSIAITAGATKDKLDGLDSATGSLESRADSIENTTASLEGSVNSINSNSSSWVNPTSYNFGPNGGPGFDLANIAPGSTAGLYLGQDNLGYHDGSNWNTYMDNSGNFYLGGTSGALTWNGTTLNIVGNIDITGGATANRLGTIESTTSSLQNSVDGIDSSITQINSTTSSLQDSVNTLDSSVSQLNTTTGSLQSGINAINNTSASSADARISATTYKFGPSNAFSMGNLAPSGNGLYLGSDYLGYYSASNWETFMGNNGEFFLGGSQGALQWNGVDSLVVSGSIYAINGYFSGQLEAGSGHIANFVIDTDNLSTDSNNFVINTSNSGSITFNNENTASVIISNAGTLQPIQVATPPTMTNTIAASQFDYKQSSGYSAYLTTAAQTTTLNTADTSKPTTGVISSGLNGYNATFTATFSTPTGGYYITSTTQNITSITQHSATAWLVFQLQKDGVTIQEKTVLVTAAGNSSTLNAGTINVMGSNPVTFSNVTLEAGSTYTINSGIKDKSSAVYGSVQNGGSICYLTTTYYVPNITSTSVTVSNPSDNSFAELTRGGFQVVASPTKAVIIPTATSGDALSVSGSISATGNITAYSTSDLRLKENIKLIPDALDKVKEINGVTFDWKEGFTDVHNFEGSDVGVIAQEVEYVLPHIVKQNIHHGYRGVRYEKLTPLLIEAIKDLSKKIDRLEKELKGLKNAN